MSQHQLEQKSLISGLGCLLKGVENEIVTVELRNGNALCGRVECVDGHFNIQMIDVVLYPRFGKLQEKFDKFFVHGRHIRFVHLPDHVDMIKVIKKQCDLFDKQKGKKQLPFRLTRKHRLDQITGQLLAKAIQKSNDK